MKVIATITNQVNQGDSVQVFVNFSGGDYSQDYIFNVPNDANVQANIQAEIDSVGKDYKASWEQMDNSNPPDLVGQTTNI